MNQRFFSGPSWILAVAAALVLVCSVHAQTGGRAGVAEILRDRNLSVPAERAAAVAQSRALQETRKAAAVARAKERGLPVRVERPDGTVQAMVELEETDSPNAAFFCSKSSGARR